MAGQTSSQCRPLDALRIKVFKRPYTLQLLSIKETWIIMVRTSNALNRRSLNSGVTSTLTQPSCCMFRLSNALTAQRTASIVHHQRRSKNSCPTSGFLCITMKRSSILTSTMNRVWRANLESNGSPWTPSSQELKHSTPNLWKPWPKTYLWISIL